MARPGRVSVKVVEEEVGEVVVVVVPGI